MFNKKANNVFRYFYYCGMKDIELDMQFPDGVKKVEVTQPTGASGVYHVSCDNFHEGQLIKTQSFGWTVALNKRTILNGDDVAALIEAIESKTLRGREEPNLDEV